MMNWKLNIRKNISTSFHSIRNSECEEREFGKIKIAEMDQIENNRVGDFGEKIMRLHSLKIFRL